MADDLKSRSSKIYHVTFEEIEEICDRAAMIKDGRLVDMIDVYALRHEQDKCFAAVFEKAD